MSTKKGFDKLYIALMLIQKCAIIYACPSGFYGEFCNITCPANCDGHCARYLGHCVTCRAGYHGDTCDQRCGNCATGSCVKDDGTCAASCVPGYYGSHCNETCLHAGCNTCAKSSGECDVCHAGKYGLQCHLTCSSNCIQDNSALITCDKFNGNCATGECADGFWGGPCTSRCGDNCLANSAGNKLCIFENGYCSAGCESTWYGDLCNRKCSVNCTLGLCARDGKCSVSCINDRFGEFCENGCMATCNNDRCDRVAGLCAECSKPIAEQSALCRSAVLVKQAVKIGAPCCIYMSSTSSCLTTNVTLTLASLFILYDF